MIIFPKNIMEKTRKELMIYCKRLEVFFGVNPGDFKIIEMMSRKDIDTKLGRKTASWLVGIAEGKEIIILDRDKFETESTHKKEEFIDILKHEICHLYICELNKDCSRSLEEGLCLNFANQNRENIIKKNNFDLFFGKSNFYNILGDKVFADIQGYALSYLTVRNLLEAFESKQIRELIKISRLDQDWQPKIEYITGMSFDEFVDIMKQGIRVKH